MNLNFTKIISKVINLDTSDPIVIGVCGGSGSGKSYYSEKLQKELLNNGIETIVINQDDFCLGKEFAKKNTSKYKWDDPENYRLDECLEALNNLKSQKTYNFLAYNLIDHRPSVNKTLKFSINDKDSKKVIILEGIFSWYGQLSEIVDYKIYLEANYFERFILRANRNVNLIGNVDFNKVVSQFFGNVWLAEKDLLKTLKFNSDLVIERNIDFKNIQAKAKSEYSENEKNISKVLYRSNNAMIYLQNLEKDHYKMSVVVRKRILFAEKLSQENSRLIDQDF